MWRNLLWQLAEVITSVRGSFKYINHRLFLALLVLGLCPTVYSTVRVFFLGQLPGDWAFSIAGQLSECVKESL